MTRRILVLGGSWFLGRAVVGEALARGWEVTTFTRGRSGSVPEAARRVRGDRTVSADLDRLAAEGPWDAVVDTSSSELAPREVRKAVRALRGRVGRWVHVSTVSVYAGWPHEHLTEESPVLDCPADAGPEFGHTGPDGSPTVYGFQKAGGERAVLEVFGPEAVLLRPGVILGPGEYVGRLPWWLRRAERGGTILAPEPRGLRLRPVDVRDVARFAMDRAESGATGPYNLAHPDGLTWEDFLRTCLRTTGGTGTVRWAPPGTLAAHDVRQWTELPLWRTHAGVWEVDPTRAVAAGLHCRPLAETVAETWDWMREGGAAIPHPRAAEHGISPERETAVLAALG
ncbi:NAD-dependent epimerase/dehydratase family protein [Streptomyces sp. AM 3-1-1]|uniref:NAD-dependent epimerase/dehydratase family protein n=1 Tax=Streptomyces sp. AM 3-1-1 TaxID=3028711 RepID=UPI0023B9D61B|nr:NAD-dependent epimerase/dehydratase family protein [Streptomyces sp. AM 3-1-1]WEH27618.1 NAD-dependent epimerase/dehydratase family protein [Streptomyces sp. AM 3-1-1]